RRHTTCYRDWSSDVCSSDLGSMIQGRAPPSIGRLAPFVRRRRRASQRLTAFALGRYPHLMRACHYSRALLCFAFAAALGGVASRSEERRVGKVSGSRGAVSH